MFLTSELLLVSKIDLLPYLPFSVEAVKADAMDINPNLKVIEISSTKNVGIDEWCNWILEKVREKQASKVQLTF